MSERSDRPKVVFVALTDTSQGRNMLGTLIESGITPAAVVVGTPSAVRRYRRNSIRRYYRQRGLLDVIWRISHRLNTGRDVRARMGCVPSTDRSLADLAVGAGIRVEKFEHLHSPDTLNRIRSFSPDFIVLGGAPLVKQSLLEIPTCAVLNAHPGVLPDARGMDVVGHSVIRGLPLGVSVFEVNEGIDSGPILLIRSVRPRPGDSLQTLTARVEAETGPAVCEAMLGRWTGELRARPQATDGGQLFRSMGRREYARARAAVNEYVSRFAEAVPDIAPHLN